MVERIVAAEIVSLLAMGISLIGLAGDRKQSKSYNYIALCGVIAFFWVEFDILSKTMNGPKYAGGLLFVIHLCVNIFGGILLIVYLHYCEAFINEIVPIGKLFFRIPIGLMWIVVLHIIIHIFRGEIFVIQDGYVHTIGETSIGLWTLRVIFLLYIPLFAFFKRKDLGMRSVCLLGLFGFAPLLATFISMFAGNDLSAITGLFSIIVVITLLQNHVSRSDLRQYNLELSKLNEDQEMQLEEIRDLNEKLEDRLAIIQSMSSIYFASYYVDLENDTYIELNASDNIRTTIKGYEKAQETLYLACEKLIIPEYVDDMKEFFDFSTIKERLRNTNAVSQVYIGVTSGWSMAYMIAGERDSNGDVTHIFFSARMIHDEKNREAKQVRKFEEYNQIIANAGLGVWHIIQKEGVASRMQPNGKMRELLGIHNANMTEEEIYNWWFERIVPEAVASVEKSVQEMMNNHFSENTYLWNHPTLGNIYVRCGGIAEILDDGTVILSGYHSDVTNIVLEEENRKKELDMARKEADAANNAKTSFLFNMSHDIRTPMNAIMGFRDLLEKNQEDPVKRADYLKKIEEASTVLLSIINNVLEMARIEKGYIEVDTTACDMEQFFDSMYDIFDELMLQKEITFTKNVNVEHPYVMGDQIKLREVFINILSNAHKYTNTGGEVSLRVEEIPSDRDGWTIYRTTIKDNGIGMKEEFLPYIFKEFARESNTTENKIEGTGLGMPIVKRLVDLMNGKIEVTSKKDVGTTFVVDIPLKITEESNLAQHPKNVLDPKLFAGKRILLAEDNDFNAEIAIAVLTDAGFIVEKAEDGKVCIEKLLQAPDYYYDLILMDIQMPNMNGYEATKAIRALEDESRANIKILAMTANAFEEDKREALRVGMNGHLPKPIDVELLMKELSILLGN